jgi:hypothetical protein
MCKSDSALKSTAACELGERGLWYRMCMRTSSSSVLYQLTSFQETSYEHYATGGHPTFLLFNFLMSIMPT